MKSAGRIIATISAAVVLLLPLVTIGASFNESQGLFGVQKPPTIWPGIVSLVATGFFVWSHYLLFIKNIEKASPRYPKVSLAYGASLITIVGACAVEVMSF